MRNPKEIALEAIIKTLKESGINVTKSLETLIDDLLDEQWEARNREILPGKDEAALFKLVKDFVTQHGSGVEN